MTGLWKTTIAVSVITLIIVVVAILWMRRFGTALAQGPDLLERRTGDLVGPTGVDCGRVGSRDNPKTATDCALAAQKAGKPFRVRYDLQGIDSAVSVAVVRAPTGKVGMVNYDSDPTGSGSRSNEVIYPKRCPEPVHLWVNPSGRINCFQQASSPPKDVMSPNLEPY
jgi:hypothetical protein